MLERQKRKICLVAELIEELSKLNPQAHIFIGSEDEMDMNDVRIEKIVRKKYGFDEENAQYYVLCPDNHISYGCVKR